MVRVSENARIVSGDFTHQHLRTCCHIPRTRQGLDPSSPGLSFLISSRWSCFSLMMFSLRDVSRRALERSRQKVKHRVLPALVFREDGRTMMGENAAAGQRCGQRCAVLRDDGAHVPASMLCAAGAAPQAHLCHLQAPRRPLSRRPRRQAPHVDRPDARSRRQATAWTHWAPRYSDKWPDPCQRGPFDVQRHVRASQTVHPLALRAALHAHARARVLLTGTSYLQGTPSFSLAVTRRTQRRLRRLANLCRSRAGRTSFTPKLPPCDTDAASASWESGRACCWTHSTPCPVVPRDPRFQSFGTLTRIETRLRIGGGGWAKANVMASTQLSMTWTSLAAARRGADGREDGWRKEWRWAVGWIEK